MEYRKKRFLFGDWICLCLGALLTLAFAPFNIIPLAILSPAILLLFWLKCPPERSFWRGWLFGLGLFGTGVYWIFISVHTYGNTSFFFAFFITACLIGILALFPALTGYLINRYFPLINNTKILCAFPAIWVLLEWTRSWIFSGFPWLLVGNSQVTSPLRGYAPIFSVYGVSLAVLMTSALLITSIMKYRRSSYFTYAKSTLKNESFRTYSLFGFNLIPLKKKVLGLRNDWRVDFTCIALIWLIGAGLALISWTKPVGDPIKVSLVQGNIAQELKWSYDHVKPTLDRYMELTRPHWDSSKLIIWPESAIPVPLHVASNFLQHLTQKALHYDTTFITGIPIKAEEAGYYNAVIAIGKGEGIYTKNRLVPFGEYIPFRDYLGGFLDFLQVPMSDFIPGKGHPKPLLANGKKIATFVCYEIAYPEHGTMRDPSVDMLLTVSNDAWFGRSIAQNQHLEIAQMRAIEMARPVLFVANDGITAIINPKGQIQSAAPQYQSTVLTDYVQGMQGRTPWQRFSMDPILIVLIIQLLLAIRNRKIK